MKIEISERENMLPIIKSDRLILRDISLSDITQDYIDWLNDYDTVKFLEIRLINQTRERVEAYIRQMKHYIQHGDWPSDYYGKDEQMRIKWKTIAPKEQ